MTNSYGAFFRTVTGRKALPYQARLASQQAPSTVLTVPTGLGKTHAVLVDWLHRRIHNPKETPTRLIWCLPGRALTEQFVDDARSRVKQAKLEVPVLSLMGGSADNDLTLRPDQPAILAGTQDILLSRALNRGYARRPFRWPIDFALLNNDCYWVFDEVQLLGDGLATSAQMAAFRKAFGVFGQTPSCWISATFDSDWLHTVDFAPSADEVRVVQLDADDREEEVVRKRLRAVKRIERAPAECRLPRGAAEFAGSKHRPGTRSLIIANTVVRAREIWTELRKRTEAELVLLHSRFRPEDREKRMALLSKAPEGAGQIVVSTQAIEAGIDIDASLLLTDLAPYASLVQRFGRVNRYGDQTESEIYWVDRPLMAKRAALAAVAELKPKDKEEIGMPYAVQEIERAVPILDALASAAPADLPPVKEPAPWDHVLRRADLLDLFDTTSDLAGNQIDISRFVRGGEDHDVYVAWREWDGGKDERPRPTMSRIDDRELCPVPIGELRAFSKKHSAWAWDALRGEWTAPQQLYPGLTVVMHSKEGGYSMESGWWPDSKQAVPFAMPAGEGEEAVDADRKSFVTYRQTLASHTQYVFEEMQALLNQLDRLGLAEYRETLERAARQHDWGKAHPVMQCTLHNGVGPYTELLAKQEHAKAAAKHCRRYFRHELASALAMLAEGESDLAAYIVAAHHGRVRMSIRSMPGERDFGDRRVTRGVRDGDSLLPCDLGAGVAHLETHLSMQPVELGLDEDGSASWSERMLRLRDELGPFRLAYLEMLLRAADETASARAAKEER